MWMIVRKVLLVSLIAAGFPVCETDAGYLAKSIARKAPFSYVGRLLFDSGSDAFIGSGTIVTRRGALTAAHNLFDNQSGYSSNLTFERGRYGDAVISRRRPTSFAIFSGYIASCRSAGSSSKTAFSHDLGLLLFSSDVAGGHALCTTDVKALTEVRLKQAIGYGVGDDFLPIYDGERPLVASSRSRCSKILDGYYRNSDIFAELGMSGGPLFIHVDGALRIAAIVVSGNQFSSAFRAIDRTAYDFIRQNL